MADYIQIYHPISSDRYDPVIFWKCTAKISTKDSWGSIAIDRHNPMLAEVDGVKFLMMSPQRVQYRHYYPVAILGLRLWV
jgi:hypothetical protein